MGWWGKSQDSKSEQQKEAAKPEVFDPKLPASEQLPKALQKIVNTAEDQGLFDDINDTYAPTTTNSNLRYAAYGSRVRTILLSAHRYVAYTSDIGESFRPVAHPNLVRGAYGVSWLYLIGDVSFEGYKSYWRNQRVLNPHLQLTEQQEKFTGLPATPIHDLKPGVVSPVEDYRTVMVQRAIFQSLASMGLPAFTIHSVVKYSGRAMKDMKNKTIRTWAPIGLGLSVVPFLPAMFDEPVEHAVDWAFHKGFEMFGGKEYAAHAPVEGKKLVKEKEL
ncbi:mitochondrial 18 KDa protein-domain-containing protein [Thelonectria olida]|uniref:Mitochondrial fission process protein 1 n=1 Tax=Thelonectria olida TaxID=1576542 RepID=A0A9P8WCR9_9HYPO|nr:mitochondrial 18 KDa protein-domain-containing protein [Thelonectria olida]